MPEMVTNYSSVAVIWTSVAASDRLLVIGGAGMQQAYVQELEKEVRRLVNENLKLKRQCKQVNLSLSLSWVVQ